MDDHNYAIRMTEYEDVRVIELLDSSLENLIRLCGGIGYEDADDVDFVTDTFGGIHTLTVIGLRPHIRDGRDVNNNVTWLMYDGKDYYGDYLVVKSVKDGRFEFFGSADVLIALDDIKSVISDRIHNIVASAKKDEDNG